MKKLVVAMLMAVGCLTSANAQIVEGLEYPRCHFGIRAGVSSTSFGEGSSSKTFPTGGLAVDFRIAPIPLYLETGAYYANKGIELDNNYYDYSSNNHTVNIPLVVSYHLYFNDNMAIQPYFGGFAGYCVSGDYEEDYGLRFGCGFNYGRLYANVGYDMGMKNFADSENYDTKSGMLFFTIGFNFVGKY